MLLEALFLFARRLDDGHCPAKWPVPLQLWKVNTDRKWILHILCYSSSSRLLKKLEISTGWKIGLFSNCYHLLVRKDTENVHYNNGCDGQLLCSWKPCSFFPSVLTMGIVQPNGQSYCNCEKLIQIENEFYIFFATRRHPGFLKSLKFPLDEKLDYLATVIIY